MSELSDRAREVVRSGTAAHRPTAAERARVTGALEKRLGSAAFANGASGLLGAKRWLWAGVSVLAAGAVGGVLLLARPEPAPAPVSDSAPEASVAPPAPSPAPAREEEPAPPAPEAPPPVAPSPPSAARRDRLAEEVAMLSKATGLLNGGRAREALRALDEHARKFPNGVLTEERRGARARALCALGMRAEADRELARLARTAPGSPHLAQARALCAR